MVVAAILKVGQVWCKIQCLYGKPTANILDYE